MIAETNPTTKVTPTKLVEMVESQKFRCAYTGVEIDRSTGSVDHIIPISKGGLHCMENIAVVHKDVNMCKNTLNLKEFVDWCRKVVAKFDSVVDERFSVFLNENTVQQPPC